MTQLSRIDKNNTTIRYSDKYSSFVKEAGGKDYVPWAWPIEKSVDQVNVLDLQRKDRLDVQINRIEIAIEEHTKAYKQKPHLLIKKLSRLRHADLGA